MGHRGGAKSFQIQTVRPRKKRLHTESDLQCALVQELRLILPKEAFVFAVPNGGTRNVIEAVNLKRQGVVPGIPDLIIIYGGKAFGLELKAQDGRMSDSQNATFPLLRRAGMRIEVARTRAEAIEHLHQMGIPMKAIDRRAA